MLKRHVAMVAVAALSLVACGDGDDDNDSGDAGAAGTVTVENTSFTPSSVSVKAGESVTWTFEDSFDHTVTADDNSFDSGGKTKGDTFEHSFPTAGTFTYKCTIHTTMKGTVTVS